MESAVRETTSTAPTDKAPHIWHRDACDIKNVSCVNKQVFVHAGAEMGESGNRRGTGMSSTFLSLSCLAFIQSYTPP